MTTIAAPQGPRQQPRSVITLRPYQSEALDAVWEAERQHLRRVLISLPTGAGKTVIFAMLIHQRPGRALVLVHRDELITQAVEKLAFVNPLMDIGVVKAERNGLEHEVVVASIQTLSRRRRLEQLGTDFQTVIVDEAHHSTAYTYELVLEYLACFETYGPLLLGVTATPERGDRSPLGRIFEEIVYQKTILEMIPTYLSDLRAIEVQLVKADFNSLHIRNGDFRDDEVEEMMFNADAPQEVAAAYGKYAIGRKTLIFSPSVALAHAMVDAFRAVGIRSIEAIDGTMPLDKRRDMLKRFHTGQTQIISNCFVLTEGFDEPSVDCIVIARPTRSRPTYTQMVGRGTRKFPGKEDCLVLDCVGATTRHDLMTISKLFNLSEKSLKGKTVTEAIDVEAKRQARASQFVTAEIDEDEMEQVARAINIFQRRPMQWLTIDQGFFSLSLGGEGWVALRPDVDERWGVWVIGKAAEAKPLSRGLTLEGAQVVAEDYARQSGSAGLTWRGASWRQKPVTDYDKMVKKMRWLQIPVVARMTAGQASDLIGQAELKKRLAAIPEVNHG
jgi:superfamily II DNA or RNA helicase